MEQKRKIVVLSSILGVLVLSFLFGRIFSPEKRYQNTYEIKLFSKIDKGDIYSLELFSADTAVRLATDGTAWRVLINGRDFPADEKKIEEFLQKLLTLKTKRFVTDNEERYPDCNIAPENGRIVLYGADDEILEEVLLGQGEDPRGEYIKVSGSKSVFGVDAGFGFYIGQDTAYWSDLQVFPEELKEKEIVRIDLFAENLRVDKDVPPVTADLTLFTAAENGRRVWKLEGNEEASIRQNTVTRIINAFTGLRAEQFSPELQASDAGPLAVAEVTTGDNTVYKLRVEEQLDGSGFLCTTETAPYGYVIHNWNLARVFTTEKELSGL
jgi:hypothetical protein